MAQVVSARIQATVRASLRERISEAVDESGRQGAGGKVLARCPFCEERTGKPDRHGKLAVYPDGGVFCYKCRFYARGDAETAEELSRFSPEEPEDEADAPSVPEGFAPLYGPEASPIHTAARFYVERVRNLAPEALEALGVGATEEGKYARRIIAPVLDERGEWLSFVTRSYTGNPRAKYLTAACADGWLPRERLLYNEAALAFDTTAPLFVVEGWIDAAFLWPYAVATLGDVSEWQVRALVEFAIRTGRAVVFAPDGDAWRKGHAHAESLKLSGAKSAALRLPPGKDPDECGRRELFNAAKAALRKQSV